MSRFAELADKLIDEAWAWAAEDMPDVLYHYTNAAGLTGILQSKSLWATEYRFVNDESEVQMALSRAVAYVSSQLAKATGDRARFLTRLLKEFEIPGRETSYVISLTECRDDLSQWRGYANEGFGFTLGMSARSIQEIEKKQKSFSFGKIKYDLDDCEWQIENVVEAFYKSFISECDGNKKDLFDCCRDCDAVILSYAALYKHSSFSGEREWRIHCYPHGNAQVRASGLKLIPYYEMLFDKEKGSPFPIK